MKKVLYVLFLLTIIPNIVFAAWWNPLSWFNNWSIFKKEQNIFLEDKINNNKVNEHKNSQERIDLEDDNKDNIISTINSSINESDEGLVVQDFRVKCGLSREEMEVGQKIRAEIDVILDRNSLYDIVWDKKYLDYMEGSGAVFEINDPGLIKLYATVTRKSDGHKKDVECPIFVHEVETKKRVEDDDEEECQDLSNEITEIEEEYYDYIKETAMLIDQIRTTAGLTKTQVEARASVTALERDLYEKELKNKIDMKTSLFYRECK